MGDHLLKMGAKEEEKKKKEAEKAAAAAAPPPVIETAKEREDRLQVEKIMSDPEVFTSLISIIIVEKTCYI